MEILILAHSVTRLASLNAMNYHFFKKMLKVPILFFLEKLLIGTRSFILPQLKT